jgi:signal transduction histidine kinase
MASRFLPPRIDILVAGLFLLAAELEAALEPVSVSRWLDGLIVLGFTVPLAWRRVAPLTVVAIASVTVVAYGQVETAGNHETLIFALALANFTAGYELPRRRAVWAPVIVLAAAVFAVLALRQDGGDLAVVAVLYIGPWAFGQLLRSRGHRVDELEAHAERLVREREQREAEAVEAERARIARELHDVISHSISVIAVQSQAIRRRLSPEQAREAYDLAQVETTARQAMAEMRRLLGVLRSDGERAPLAPHPGLAQLPRLADQVRAAGLAVDLRMNGDVPPLPPGVDLVAYRIVQEALTNALKHAHAREVIVDVGYRDRVLALSVSDDGDGAAAHMNGGHGLVGMRERVALYGGTLQLDSGSGESGFRVHATLPVQTSEAP